MRLFPSSPSWLLRRPPPEVSHVVVGSTGSGKSEGELVDLVRLAERRTHAVVLLDGHGPLAVAAAGHWAARGFVNRLVYEPLDTTDRVLCWDMLPRSAAADPARRRLEDAETRDEVAQCFLAQRNLLTAVEKPFTKEWLEAAIALCLAQPQPEPLDALASAFQVGTPTYERLLRDCDQRDIVAKFRNLERLKRRSEVQYETVSGASRRLLELVCRSEVVRLRCRPGPFDWLAALRERRLVAFDGGGVRSRELKRALFLLAGLQVVQAVRRSFTETRRPLPVVLVLEEAGALGLVAPFVLSALQELRKAGLAVHLLTQSCLDFGDPALFEAVLANAPWQAWYQVLSPADQEVGAKVLTNAAFESMAVHFTRPRMLPVTEAVRRRVPGAGRSGVSFLRWYRHVQDAYYKPPQLQEQEYRTRLATLRVGERLVRDRRGMRRERVRMLRPPRVPGGFEAFTRRAIEHVREQNFYLAARPDVEPAPGRVPDAADRLRRGHDDVQPVGQTSNGHQRQAWL